jgi:hypothetical protein
MRFIPALRNRGQGQAALVCRIRGWQPTPTARNKVLCLHTHTHVPFGSSFLVFLLNCLHHDAKSRFDGGDAATNLGWAAVCGRELKASAPGCDLPVTIMGGCAIETGAEGLAKMRLNYMVQTDEPRDPSPPFVFAQRNSGAGDGNGPQNSTRD